MNRNYASFAIIVCLTLVTLACGVNFNLNGDIVVRGSGKVVSEERTVSDFSLVSLANQGDLVIEFGDQEKLVIETQENLLQYIVADVSGGKLRIGTQDNINIRTTRPIRYFLTVTQLEGLEVLSSGNITAPGIITERFTVENKSSGNIRIESLDADQLRVDVMSSGNIDISDGQVEEQIIRVYSSGDYDAARVQAMRADVDVLSSGNARIWVTDRLDAEINSSGNLYYRGEPGSVSTRENSSGKVIKTGN